MGRVFQYTEVFKFSLYMVVPVGLVLLYNMPNVRHKLTSSHTEFMERVFIPEEELFKIPYSAEEARIELDRLKKVYNLKD